MLNKPFAPFKNMLNPVTDSIQTIDYDMTALLYMNVGNTNKVMQYVIVYLLLAIIQLILVIVVAGISSVIERKIFAAFQRRQGPSSVGAGGVLQFLADGVKLLQKEIINPLSSSVITFTVAPMFVFTFAFFGWLFIPFSFGYAFFDLELGVLWMLAFGSLGVYGLILSGWASNSKYAFLGSLRSAAQMISYEISLGFIIICVALVSGSYNLTDIVLAQQSVWFILTLFPVAVIFFVSILAETNRAPFDLPEAEAELVAGYNLEYSAIPFALFFLGEYSSISLMNALFATLFLGGWLPLPIHKVDTWDIIMYYYNKVMLYLPDFSSIRSLFVKNVSDVLSASEESLFVENILNFPIFSYNNYMNGLNLFPMWGNLVTAIKITFLLVFFILVRATFPRFRYDHLMTVGWKIFLPITLGYVVFLAGVLKTFNGLVMPLFRLDYFYNVTLPNWQFTSFLSFF